MYLVLRVDYGNTAQPLLVVLVIDAAAKHVAVALERALQRVGHRLLARLLEELALVLPDAAAKAHILAG